MKYIYEVRDTTDDEMYYTLGFYETAHDAVEAVKESAKDNWSISEYQEESEEITVIQTELGWGGASRNVFSINRSQHYDDIEHDYFWRTNHINEYNPNNSEVE